MCKNPIKWLAMLTVNHFSKLPFQGGTKTHFCKIQSCHSTSPQSQGENKAG
jgi:hypothetical protein